jgi:hypothetical protein
MYFMAGFAAPASALFIDVQIVKILVTVPKVC